MYTLTKACRLKKVSKSINMFIWKGRVCSEGAYPFLGRLYVQHSIMIQRTLSFSTVGTLCPFHVCTSALVIWTIIERELLFLFHFVCIVLNVFGVFSIENEGLSNFKIYPFEDWLNPVSLKGFESNFHIIDCFES